VSLNLLQSRSLALHDVAAMLSHTMGLTADEAFAELQILYGQLVLQQRGLFVSLLAGNKQVLRAVLWRSPERTSAIQHTNSLANSGMHRLRTVLRKELGFNFFSCKGSVLRHDRQALYYVTKENFESTTLQLYQTASSTVATQCAVLRARNLPDYLQLMVNRTLAEQQGNSVRNLRHSFYRDRLILVLELDKGREVYSL
jgi:hypothetical protein